MGSGTCQALQTGGRASIDRPFICGRRCRLLHTNEPSAAPVVCPRKLAGHRRRRVNTLRALLRFLDRRAHWALPVGVFTGVVLPDLAAFLRPVVLPAVVGTLTIALLRLDWKHLQTAARHPLLPSLLAIWQLIVSPLLAWAAAAVVGLPPDFRLVLVLQAAAPPIGSAPVFAMILGLDGVLAVIGTVTTTLLLPLTLTPLVGPLLSAAGVEIDLGAFLVRVSLVVVAPFAVASLIRRFAGIHRLTRNRDLLGGANVLLLVLFSSALMDGVTARFLRDPAYVLALLLLACVATLALHLAGLALFRRAGVTAAYSASLLSGNRNVGIMLVITAGTATEAFSLYAGIAQIPMYFAPLLLMPMLRRSRRAADESP